MYICLYMIGMKWQCPATAQMPMKPRVGSQATGHTLPVNNSAGPDIALLTIQDAIIRITIQYIQHNGSERPEDAPREHEKEPQDLVKRGHIEAVTYHPI